MKLFESATIEKHFDDGAKQLAKGKESFLADHVHTLIFDPETKVLSGRVRGSQKANNVYTCMVCFGKFIERATCTCVAGIHGKCHHVAALLFHAADKLSCTSLPCTWNRPAHAGKGNLGLPIEEAVGKERGLHSIDSSIDVGAVLEHTLKTFPTNQSGAAAFKWVVEGENGTDYDEDELLFLHNQQLISDIVPNVETVLRSEMYEAAACKSTYLQPVLKISDEVQSQVVKLTIGQATNPLWFTARRHRITATKFHGVLKNVESNKTFKTLAKEIGGRGADLTGIHSIEWGKTHEKTAIREFERKMKALNPEQDPKVEETGLWLHPSGVLGASPDGFFLGNVVEVKCPYSLRGGTLKEGLEGVTDYIIFLGDDGLWHVNKEHEYYDQIQGNIYITRRKSCVLLIWTPRELAVVTVQKDTAWARNIDKMIDWYFYRYIPDLVSHL